MTQSIYSKEIQSKVIELHTKEGLGLHSIAKWFNGRPSRTTIMGILKNAGVYQGPAKVAGMRKRMEARQALLDEKEKQWRHRIAVCLWNLRNGTPVERTCYNNRWPQKSVWYHLRKHPCYQKILAKKVRSYKHDRIQQRKKLVSRIYPRESQFVASIESQLRDAGILYEVEPRIEKSRLRADFRVGNYLIECKVDTTHGKLKICIGQCCIYRVVGSCQPVVVIPEDVDMRYPFYQVFRALNVVLLSEKGLVPWLSYQKSVRKST